MAFLIPKRGIEAAKVAYFADTYSYLMFPYGIHKGRMASATDDDDLFMTCRYMYRVRGSAVCDRDPSLHERRSSPLKTASFLFSTTAVLPLAPEAVKELTCRQLIQHFSRRRYGHWGCDIIGPFVTLKMGIWACVD
jgi:hypothetical protein